MMSIEEDLWDLIRQKRKRIAELEEEIKKMAEQLKTKDTINNLYKNTLELKDSDFSDLVYENANLKKENAKLQEQIKTNRKFYKEQLDKFNYESKEIDLFRERCGYDGWDVKDILLDLYKQTTELDKLKEQLKDAILPKFKIDDEVYHIRSWSKEIIKAKVNNINVYIVKGYDNFEYGLREWCEGDKRYQSYVGDMKDEELVFATESDAQKYLEEHK